MATQADVRGIAITLPGTREEAGRFAFSVQVEGKLKAYAWVWLERLGATKARVPNVDVLALRVANLAQKDLMLQAEPTKFFTEPHYRGYPAVLLRLGTVGVPELRTLLTDAWQCVAPSAAIRERSTPPRGRTRPGKGAS